MTQITGCHMVFNSNTGMNINMAPAAAGPWTPPRILEVTETTDLSYQAAARALTSTWPRWKPRPQTPIWPPISAQTMNIHTKLRLQHVLEHRATDTNMASKDKQVPWSFLRRSSPENEWFVISHILLFLRTKVIVCLGSKFKG